ncbi:MAG: hypothetical protein V8R75_01695 [Oscillospiraceae bacterium]|jgi:hypothetical protein
MAGTKKGQRATLLQTIIQNLHNLSQVRDDAASHGDGNPLPAKNAPEWESPSPTA